MTYALSIYL